jgi:hypothetical protein
MDQLEAAQAELERHLVTGLDGRCRSCGDLEPCRERGRLEAVFALYNELPRRRPGVTGIDLAFRASVSSKTIMVEVREVEDILVNGDFRWRAGPGIGRIGA